ncbi:MAG: acyl-CoA dehydrogenase family protein [Desulfobacterales bacterium]
MDITLSKSQQDIAKEARNFLKKECPREFVEEMHDNENGYTDALWSKIVKIDWQAMYIPEAYEGMGMSLLDLVMILEETGRALLPGPFFSTVLYAAEMVKAAGSEAQKEKYLKAIANGDLKATVAVHEPDGGADLDYIQMEAVSDGGGYRLNGTKVLVPDAHVSDLIICAVRTSPGDSPENGVTLFIVDTDTEGVTVSPLPTMDAVRKYSVVEFKNVNVGSDAVLGEVDKGWPPFFTAVQRANVGIAAESIGGAQWAMEAATDYAKMRVQFDQPIGAFQAIKHRCAQMFADVESSRSLLYYAAWAQDHEDPSTAAIAASAAKAFCTEAFKNVVCGTVQVMGGAGFIWENEVHFYLKRAKANEIIMGDPDYHREKILRLLSL